MHSMFVILVPTTYFNDELPMLAILQLIPCPGDVATFNPFGTDRLRRETRLYTARIIAH
ncbi:hypothetical protein E2C01_063678 [Portunus trituberculatus]|uniref:Uncharacterized protein n=1 Tax=Portunus trituberculatus TaxID=210409 RepID=A0A5B7HH07_PORTR|nr:hypothetical protein [Portunus trituberculatus]